MAQICIGGVQYKNWVYDVGIFSADSAPIFSALVTLALDEEIKYFIILSPGSEERSYIYSNLLLVSLNQVRTHTI